MININDYAVYFVFVRQLIFRGYKNEFYFTIFVRFTKQWNITMLI